MFEGVTKYIPDLEEKKHPHRNRQSLNLNLNLYPNRQKNPNLHR